MGPFPIQELHTDEPKGTEPPALPERGGLGPIRDRHPIRAADVELWSEVFYLGIEVASGTSAATSTRQISQPFRVLWMTVANRTANASDTQVAVVALNATVPSVNADNVLTKGLITGSFAGFQGDQQEWSVGATQIANGRIVRDVPTRLHALVVNGGATDDKINVTISVEYLAPADNPHPKAPGHAAQTEV